MQNISNGIDLVELGRIEKILSLHDERFLNRVFTVKEREYADKNEDLRIEKLAGRFAAKEAIMKVIGTGWRGKVSWTDIEIVNDPMGKPVVRLAGEVKRITEDMGISDIDVSITHTKQFAIASAVALFDSSET
jgi:holo-[acyl-carrier protein] synthase